MKEKVCNTIIQKLKLDNNYREYFDIVYGKINFNESIATQLIEFETKRFSKGFNRGIKNIKDLFNEYSVISYEMAKATLKDKADYKDLANQLLMVLINLIGATHVEEDSSNRKIISDTILDFEYARGNCNVASLRLAPLIRQIKKEGK